MVHFAVSLLQRCDNDMTILVFQKPKRLLEQLEGGKVSCYDKCRCRLLL